MIFYLFHRDNIRQAKKLKNIPLHIDLEDSPKPQRKAEPTAVSITLSCEGFGEVKLKVGMVQENI